MIEDERHRARQLDGAADPPAAAGRRIQRILSITIVDQHADAALQTQRAFGLRGTASANRPLSLAMRASLAPVCCASSKNWLR